MKIKKNLPKEKLPSQNRMYFSEQPIAELMIIIDGVVQYDPVRCDCDSHRRCHHHKMESKVEVINAKLKEKIMEVFED